jgi:hypothetical protein
MNETWLFLCGESVQVELEEEELAAFSNMMVVLWSMSKTETTGLKTREEVKDYVNLYRDDFLGEIFSG